MDYETSYYLFNKIIEDGMKNFLKKCFSLMRVLCIVFLKGVFQICDGVDVRDPELFVRLFSWSELCTAPPAASGGPG